MKLKSSLLSLSLFFSLFLSLFLFGCVSGHCGPDGKSRTRDASKQKIFIYKYDGSKQCDAKPGADLDQMARELLGVKIFSMSKKSDGQIRVQVCGALTGKANVYEVSKKDLLKAEALGFKKWNF